MNTTGFGARAALGLSALLSLAASAAADDLTGPAFGTGVIRASIDAGAEPDVDPYEARLVAGERLTVVLGATARGTLRPGLRLFGPDGEVTPGFEAKRKGRQVALRGFEVPTTGRWILQVAGRNGSTGRYVLNTRIRRAPSVRARRFPVGDTLPAVHDFPFEALDGSRLHFTMTVRRGADVNVTALTDPSGGDVPGAAGLLASEVVIRKAGRRHHLKDAALHAGDGTYTLTIGYTTGKPGNVDLHLNVKLPARPRGRTRVLAELDPYLPPRAQPLSGKEGQSVRLSGARLSGDPAAPPVVYVGGRRAPVVGRDISGASFLDVLLPAPPEPEAVVDVLVVNPDGQAAYRDAYLRYEPASFEDRSGTAVPPTSALDDLSAFRGLCADLDGDGARDDLVLVSPGNPAVTHDERFLGPPQDVVLTAEPGTATPGRIGVTGEEDVYRFDLPRAGWVEVRSGYPGSLGDGLITVLGPTTPDTVVATRNDISLGPFEAVRVRLEAGTWFLRVTGGGGRRGSYTVSGRFWAGSRPSSGTQASRTRVLIGAPDGTLSDETSTRIPQVESGVATGAPSFQATAVALGDVSGDLADDLILGGFVPGYLGDYLGFSSPNRDVLGAVRVLANDGSGVFSHSTTHVVPGLGARAVFGRDELERDIDLLVGYEPFLGATEAREPPSAMAVGDVDGDGDEDLIVAFPEPLAARSSVTYFEYVDFDASPPYVPSSALDEYGGYIYTYNTVLVSGTQLIENRAEIGGGLAYTTGMSLPLVVPPYYGPAIEPGLHARDVALGDVDGDDDLDLVLTWDDPTSVSVYGRSYPQHVPIFGAGDAYGVPHDVARTATRVLENDGSGRFTDVTDSWMPAGDRPEFWQGSRTALADLDGDQDPDLVVLHRDGLEAYLRREPIDLPLTPTGGTTTPGRIAANQEVDRYEFDVTAAGVVQVLAEPGSLVDLEVALYGPEPAGPFLRESFAEFGFPGRIVLFLFPGRYEIEVRGPGAPRGTGSYGISAGALRVPGDVAHTRPALRVLENQGPGTGFVDVTSVVLPQIDAATGDDLRGEALLVADVNGDGHLDITVGTRETLRDAAGGRIPSTRLLLGSGGFRFTLASSDFFPGPGGDTGEANDALVGDLGGEPTLFLLSERPPEQSAAGRILRAASPR